MQDGRVIYAKGYGVESIERDTRVTPSTLFRWDGRDMATARGDTNEVLVLGEGGAPQQSFRVIRGVRAAATYLHDGLNAFRRVPPER